MESATKSIKDLNKVYQEAVYGQTAGQKLAKREKDDDAAGAPNKDKRYTVTYADKKGNTPAYQKYKAGNKNYKAADHLKDEYEPLATSLEESGKFTVEEIQAILEKDSYDTVAAVIDYDRSKKGSKDATYDSDHGEKKKAKQERDYAAWERSKMKKDDPNWKHKKYHTGMHGEEVEGLGKSDVGEEFKALTPDKKRQIRNQADRRKKSADRAQMSSDYETSTKQDQQVRNMKRVSEETKEEDKDLKKRSQFHTARKEFKAYQQKKELKYWKTKKKNPVKAPNQQLKGFSNYVEGVEQVDELYKGKHGQSEKEYQAGRSDAGKRISGDEKHGPASYSRRGVKQQEPTKPGEKPKHTPKLGSAEKDELAYRKSRLNKVGYQRNPEKGEEEERKAEKARKESGRMPPRGDKRREDFEKWYAANVK